MAKHIPSGKQSDKEVKGLAVNDTFEIEDKNGQKTTMKIKKTFEDEGYQVIMSTST